jgi:hypothetical protein
MNQSIIEFFTPSDLIEHEILRPLSHIRNNWDVMLDYETGRYMDEDDSFGWLFNNLINELASTETLEKYHNSEDRLAEHVKQTLSWDIKKESGFWLNKDGTRIHPSDYLATLEQGGFNVDGVSYLIVAAAGRIKAAIKNNQKHFDAMEKGHRTILAGVLSAILYHMEPYEDDYRQQAS